MFWGWGAEDDDLRNRVIANKLSITRYSQDVGRYHSCSHHYQKPNPKRYKRISYSSSYIIIFIIIILYEYIMINYIL